MSRTGTDAAMAATQIRGILFALLKPTKQANDTLNEFGLSAAGLRKKIQDDGLLATLKLLTQTFGDNEEAQGKVFANTRALSGVLDLMGKNLGSTEEIFSRMNDTAGITAEAFTDLEKSASFKLNKSLNDLGVAFTEIGSVLLETFTPAIQKIASLLVSLGDKFQSLSPTVKKITVIFVALVAALGPFLIILGAMSSGIGILVSGFSAAIPIILKVAGAFKSLTVSMLANPVGLIAAAVVTLVAGFVEYLHRLEPAVSRTKTFFNILKSLGNPLKFAALQAEDAAKAINQEKKETEKATKAKQEFKDILENIQKPIQKTTTETEQLGHALDEVSKASAITLSIETGDFDFETGQFAQGDIAVGAQQVETTGIAGVEAPGGDAVGSALEGLLAMENQANAATNAINSLNESQRSLSELGDMVGGQLSGAFSELGNSMVASLGLGEGALGSFTASFLAAALDAVGAALSVSVANAIAGASAGSLLAGPIAPIVLPALIAGMVGLVKSQFASVPKFANGGIVSGPTMGMMGEYPGAKANPEVIAPLDKLQGMMGQGGAQNVNVGGEFKINGQDLVVALQRADRNRSRIK